mmetsp:Transcript_29305/g.54093  ORF Transcript_29305/g.54093 Transcript_29305/m.54093 type:complete len:381 (+) Transcript_29305:168-1310(+)|eukprot:CAMPEP_0201875388 /NCGR_PEP_ID=MMETSP0902-20130614/7385_1 /ASSEMBLY_ACC=CAM_ASM_000551 /TAXON_ID=420261 /ORGANISM="Thalassiosira antarctica, Strain CCMP982" /LENGTH=380 /DNA_ID=CAMNT_0048402439 /DNA_START=77 /DNA_END=1219 /DNA_ORIENTATION=+
MLSSIDTIKSGGGRFRFLLLTASFTILVVLHRFHRVIQKSNEFIGTNNTTKKQEAFVNPIISSNDVVLATLSTKEQISTTSSSVKELDENLEPSNIPIYFSDSSSGVVSSMDYRFLASIWDRGTTYEDILLQAMSNNDATSSSTKEALERNLNGNNITTIFHTSPKTASSTLRKACMETQYDSCNLPHKPEKMKWPEGFRSPKRLTQLFGQCPETRHFCVKGALPITKNYTQFYPTRSFLHMFPFRNYDEWAISALHQISYRDGEDGCREMDGLLDQCLPHSYELNFGRYTKSILADFIELSKRLRPKIGGNNDHHILLLYNYQYLNKTLMVLNDAWGVPLLPGTETKVNSVRPDESCKDEERLMKKFHDCFSDKLVELH